MSSLTNAHTNLPLTRIQIKAVPIALASLAILARALYIFQTISLKQAALWIPAAFAGNALGVYFRPFFDLAVEKTPRLTGW